MCLKFGSNPRADLLGSSGTEDAASQPERAVPAYDPQRLPADIALAANRIRPHIRQTPVERSAWLSERCEADVWLKLENQQITGSFKLRGAFNKLLSMDPAERAQGCVAASSGNHGAAVAYAMQSLDVDGVVFVPEQTSSAKIESIRRAGCEVRFHGTDGVDTENHARAYAEERGMAYLSPYNDWAVVAGQGTCGAEIAAQLDDVDAVLVAVGGGGLIAGIGAFLKASRPGVEIVSCQPAASAVMTESVAAGEIVELAGEPTLSDGTAGGIETGAITFDLCRRVVDRYVTVSEDEIADAMRGFIDAQHQLLEGAAGVAVAGLLKDSTHFRGRKVVVVVCGGNVSRDTLRSVL